MSAIQDRHSAIVKASKEAARKVADSQGLSKKQRKKLNQMIYLEMLKNGLERI